SSLTPRSTPQDTASQPKPPSSPSESARAWPQPEISRRAPRAIYQAQSMEIVADTSKPKRSAAHLAEYRWQPGRSGNPTGRPKSLAERVRSMTNGGDDVIAFLVRVVSGEEQGATMRDRLDGARM